jgi:RNA polymerase sigma factor (sigma-70 family)
MSTPVIDWTYVRRVALLASRHLPAHLDRDDLVQEANIAAWQAADRYDEAFGVPFNSFLAVRVRGAVTDYARFWQHTRRRVKAVVVSLNEPAWAGDGELIDTLPDATPTVDIDLRDGVAGQLARFNVTTRRVLGEYFMIGRTMKAIGVDLGLCEARISQIITRDIERMRNMPSWQRLADVA